MRSPSLITADRKLAGLALLLLMFVGTPVFAQNNMLEVGTVEVEPGNPFVLPVLGDWPEDVDGLTIALTFPPAPPIDNLAISIDNTLIAALEPDFIIVNLFPNTGECVYAVLFDAYPPFDYDVLPPVGFPLLVAEITGDIPTDTPDQDINFDFTNGVGSPPANNIFVVNFESVPVEDLTNGAVEVRNPQPIVAPFFVRGDVNMDWLCDLGDVIFHLQYTFDGGPQPVCLDAGDANDDGHSDVSDAIFMLDYLFALGPAPWPPFPAEGPDGTPGDPIECETPLYFGEIDP